MKKLLIITTLIGLWLGWLGFVIPQKAEAGSKYTQVIFKIFQSYYGGGITLHRLWIYGEATHWDPRGISTTRGFWHRPGGPEIVPFGRQLVGNSRGKADIKTWGVVCWASKCTSGMKYYTVPQQSKPWPYDITVIHRW